MTGDDAFALRYEGTRYVLRAYTGTAASVTIPSHVDVLGYQAFKDNTTLISVTVPASVTSMETSVFNGCTNLTTVTLNEGLTGINTSAFEGCASLSAINIPNSVTSIGSDAFRDCASLTSLTLTDSITSVSSVAFRDDNNLRVYVPTPHGSAAQAVSNACNYYVTGDDAFALRYEGTHYVLRAYTGTAASVTIPSHVDVLGYLAFKDNATLTSVTVPASVTGMETSVFEGCANLTTVTLSEGLTGISTSAFDGCASLTAINIPNSVTSIGSDAFRDCASLTSLTLTDSITSVSSVAFRDDNNLRVYVPTPHGSAAQAVSNACNYYVTGDDAFALRYEGTHYVLRAYTGTAASVTIPSHVDVLGYLAFKDNATLTSVTVPASVTGMETSVFEGCANLTTVTLSEGLTGISTSAFDGCASLTAINIPNSVTSIGSDAFRDCASLTSLTLPDSLASISGVAFRNIADLRLSAGCGSYGAGWAADSGYTQVAADAPAGGKQLVLIHDWSVDYAWNADHSAVTGSRTCARDTEHDHGETETVSATSEITTPATCTDMGKTTYTSAAFLNAAFSVQAVTETDVPALGHVWGTPSYAWKSSNTKVTASRTCQRDANHKETETVAATSEITKPATCTAKGKRTYTSAAFANAAFAVQTKTLTNVPALGHDWDEPSYEWNEARTQVTATRVCKRNSSHKETETAAAAGEITTPATCTDMGQTTYTSAAFLNAAFSVQAVTETDVPALGHDWEEPGYEWNEARTQVTATRVCKHNPDHRETETAAATGEITTPATCTEMGETTYMSTAFANAAFSVQVLKEANVPAAGHAWAVVPSVAADSANGVRGGVACAVCGAKQTENRPVSARKVLRVPALMESIEEEAFYGVAAEQVILSGGVTAIGSKAFAGCGSLLIAVIPSSVTSIAADAFSGSDVAVICPDESYAASWCDAHHIPHNPQ